ncbi:MAG: 5-deoxy-glucuronate isomerase [Acidimicrobiales bacterium]
MPENDLHHLRGSLASGPWSLELTAARAGWSWCSLRVLELSAEGTAVFDTGDEEMLLLPLSGSCRLSAGESHIDLAGRRAVFDSLSDFAYLPRRTRVEVSSAAGGRFALPGTRAERSLPLRCVDARDVPVELRGAGGCSRQVNNLCLPGTLDADRLMVCEVLTPAGNWSSYPPHKHDEDRPGESVLEEIYYFEVARGPSGEGVAYQRVYGTSQRPVELLAEVRSGDAVRVPHGWHGPSMASPGYDLYYLNVMGGPGPRAWLVCDDPAHAWVRGTWADQEIDPRLPLARGGSVR